MKLRALALALLCACASYHLLPLPAASGTAQALPVRYEKRRLLFFTSTEVDGLLERIFASGPEVLATVVRPRSGVFASGDAGGTWKFAELPAQQSPPQVFREVLFDPRDPRRICARTGSQVLRSEDGGSTWTATIPGGEVIDALAMGTGGAVLAAGRGRIFVSEDGARTWRPVEVQTPAKAWRARNLAANPAHPGTIYLSLHADAPPPEPGKDLLSRLQALLDYSSDEAVSALALADAHDEKPRPVAWASASV